MEKVDLLDISSVGFEIILDWLYNGHTCQRDSKNTLNRLSDYGTTKKVGHKAADVLMIGKLQNELIAQRSSHLFRARGYNGGFTTNFCRGKYYHFVLKSAVANNMMQSLQDSQAESGKDKTAVAGTSQVVVRRTCSKLFENGFRGTWRAGFYIKTERVMIQALASQFDSLCKGFFYSLITASTACQLTHQNKQLQ